MSVSLCTQLVDVDRKLFFSLSEAKHIVEGMKASKKQYESYISDQLFTGNRGRPRYSITKEQLEYFISFRFTAPEIAKMLGVSDMKLNFLNKMYKQIIDTYNNCHSSN